MWKVKRVAAPYINAYIWCFLAVFLDETCSSFSDLSSLLLMASCNWLFTVFVQAFYRLIHLLIRQITMEVIVSFSPKAMPPSSNLTSVYFDIMHTYNQPFLKATTRNFLFCCCCWFWRSLFLILHRKVDSSLSTLYKLRSISWCLFALLILESFAALALLDKYGQR